MALMPQVMNGKGRQEAYDLMLRRFHAVESEVSLGRKVSARKPATAVALNTSFTGHGLQSKGQTGLGG